ncbi:benzoate 4-monooxygenase cytochrome P450 [Aaosphaeria arxii CBS 175.79]|uniref:Benzoate 4-monooxygenase cytochrome P450 n=1 Tax=Aaosphaeria arxii CBS 175.79 TaxID=1450172 RepID=A0A6A5XG41_9PLEO|nr:benzoate 4-monooxygenase cytochrome P450 [Aaosphaeria arxii CBS 175.79]KAF2011829.1 benzoate 4-monooxygenase cytochrome P450 [Aaosphaeria arxii CBS 175.79]
MSVQLLVSAVLCIISCVICHRLYFHPLARYPGPLFGRITDWYSVYHSLRGDRHLNFLRLHRTYGPVVRYGPNRLSFSTPTAFQAVYSSQANTKKSYWYDTMTFYMKVPSTHATTNKKQHARKRWILSQALSDRMTVVYEQAFLNLLQGFIRRFHKVASHTKDGWSPSFDMTEEFTLLAFDSMGMFCFGESFGSLQDPKKAEIIENTLEGFRGMNAIGYMPGISWLQLDAFQSRVSRALKEYEAHATMLANRRGSGEGFTFPELQSESSLLVTTGADTIAAALANIVFHLVNNPDILARLNSEIRGTFSDLAEIRIGKSLNSCSYLAACIDESLRLSSVVGGCLMREVGPGGTTIDGDFIPQGVDVGVPFHVIMRNPDYYDAPLEYLPQRWLPETSSPEKIRAARSAFCPFGIGPTGCVGKSWALVEMKITIAQLLFQYDLQRDESGDTHVSSCMQRLHQRDEESLDRFVVTSKGPKVKFRLAKATGTANECTK